jgi:hypothetical protein
VILAPDDRAANRSLSGVFIQRDPRVLDKRVSRSQFARVYAAALPIEIDVNEACSQSHVLRSASDASTPSLYRPGLRFAVALPLAKHPPECNDISNPVWVRIFCVGGNSIDFGRLMAAAVSGSIASG